MNNKLVRNMGMKTKKLFVWVIISLIAGLLMGACGLVPGTGKTTAQATAIPTVVSDVLLTSAGHVAPRDFRYLAFAQGGTVAEILVKKGDQVTAGQVLARLSNREQGQAALTAANLELATAQQAYDDFNRTAGLAHTTQWVALLNAKTAVIAANRAWDNVNTTDFVKKLDDAVTTVNTKNDDLKTAQDDFDKVKTLSQDNPTRKSAKDKLDTAQLAYDEAVRQQDELQNQQDLAMATLQQANDSLAEAQRKFDATQSGADAEQLALIKSRLDNAKAQVTAAQSALDNLELKAPFAGTVVDINVVANDLTSPSNWAVLVADFSQWYVETKDLSEIDVVKLSLDKTARIVPDALPDMQLTGKVAEIANVYTEKNGDITYNVRILLDNPPDSSKLRWGMTVQVTFPK